MQLLCTRELMRALCIVNMLLFTEIIVPSALPNALTYVLHIYVGIRSGEHLHLCSGTPESFFCT